MRRRYSASGTGGTTDEGVFRQGRRDHGRRFRHGPQPAVDQRRGCEVALADVNDVGFAGTAAACAQHGVRVSTRRLDVADRDAVFAWADFVRRARQGQPIFNNAGVSLAASAETARIADLEWIVGINFWGVVHGTQAFLPHLRASGDGHVVNTSSLFGLVAMPTQSAYNATKFAVRGFTEALRMEPNSTAHR